MILRSLMGLSMSITFFALTKLLYGVMNQKIRFVWRFFYTLCLPLVCLLLLLTACGEEATPTNAPPTPTVVTATATLVSPTSTPVPATATITSTPTVSPLVAPISPLPTPVTIRYYTYTVVNSYPHDPNAFTEGLLFDGQQLYESTGRNGFSNVRKVDLLTGAVTQQRDLDAAYFGEGIVIFGQQLYQLTWQSNIGFIYDKATFAPLGQFTYPTEGWGFTHDGQRLIMSDGSNRLTFRDPATLAAVGYIDVFDDIGPVMQINELEVVQGSVYANIWLTDRIAMIDPQSGQVTGWIDLTGLLSPADRAAQPVDVLNGIAYLPAQDRLFVTGKLWPRLFEIKIVPF